MLKLPKKVTIIGLFTLLTVGLSLGFFVLRLDTPSILGWMDNWMYRKPITVTNNGSTQTNTDILLEIDTAALIAAEKLQPTCSDLRFTDSDESTALSYWIESGCNTDKTQIWVRIPSVPNGGKIIYMYYHNYSATTSTEMPWTGSFTMMATGTCPTGWTRNTSFDNKFPYGSATYGTTGGSASHNHTGSGTTNSVAETFQLYDSGSVAAIGWHTHTYNITTDTRNDTYPPYLQMIFCSKTQKLEIPAGLISIFDSNPGTEWTRFSALDNKFTMGNAAYGATGGTDTQADPFSGSTSAPSGTAVEYKNYYTDSTSSTSTHTHTVSGTTASSSILPPYINVLFYSKNATGTAATNQIAMVNAIPPLGWTRVTAFDAKFLRGASAYGGTGGATTHTHTYSATTSVASLAVVWGVDDGAVTEHSHTISGTTTAGNNVPPYFSTIYVKRNTSLVTSLGAEEIIEVPNTPPDTPTNLLTEGQTNPTNVTDVSPEFSALFSDVDTLDQGGYYQVQVNTDAAFTGTTIWDSGQTAFSTPVENGAMSTEISYAGTPLSSSITYYWRIRFWTTAVQGGIPSEWSSVAQFMLTISTWTSDAYTYRKSIFVNNTSGSTLSNQNVLVQVDTAALISASRMLSSCYDMRFKDSDDTTDLTYWVEGGCNTTATQVWIKIPSTPNGGKTILMYYGNSTATNGELSSSTIFHLLSSSSTCPTGWTRNSGYDNKFAYGSTSYGTSGGSATHTHTISGTTNSVSGTTQLYGDSTSSTVSSWHTHPYSFSSTSANSVPAYLQMPFCYKNKLDIPTGLVSIFTASPGTGWTRFSALDNKFARGGSTYGTTGGADSQTESFSGSTSAPSAGGAIYKNYNTNAYSSSTTHTHTVSGTLASSSILPPYVNVLYYSRNTAGVAAPKQITMVNTLPPLGWTRDATFDGKYLRGASTYGGTGGATTHTHTYSATTGTSASTGVYSLTGSTTVIPHTHTISGTSGAGNNLPPYLLTIFAKRIDSLPSTLGAEETIPPSPPVPTTLYTEGAADPIDVTDRSPEFNAIFTDIHTSHTGTYYQIEVNNTSDFSGTTMWDSTKKAITVANNARSADIIYEGETLERSTTYYWRIKFWDSKGAEGEWVSAQFTMSDNILYFSDTLASAITTNSATISSNISVMPAEGATDTGFIFGTSPAWSTIQTPPISAYYFNETDARQIIDSANGVNGTNTGSTVTTGIIGNAHDFNGTTDYITLPKSDNFNLGSSDFTISIWVYIRNVGKGTQFIAENRGAEEGVTKGWLLYSYPSYLRFSFNSGGVAYNDVLNSTVIPTNNEWSHIVVTRKGTNFEMYLNNIPVATGTFDGTIDSNPTYATIGMSAIPGLSGLDGLIDNYVIYKKGFTSNDIATLYNNGSGTEEYTKKVSTGASSTTGPITTNITSLTHLTDYYFRPYAVTDGDTVFGHSSTFQTLADNFVPTASKDNISGVADIYAGKTLDIVTRYSDADGIADLDKLYLQIKNPTGTNIEYYANASETNQTGQTPTSVSGSEYISNITYDLSVNSPDTNDITVTWHVTPNWNWTRDTSIQYGVKTLDKKAAESTYDYTVTTYKYENRLTFTGTLTATDYNGDSLNSGDWTKPNSTVNFTGIRVVYAGTTDVYPNDIDFDARVTNSETSFWDDYTSVGRDISINATTVDATNASDTYTFSIPQIPTGGEDISNVTFIIKTDKTSPVISSLTSSTHPDSNTWYTATTATFNWTITDADSGLQGVWYLLNNSETTANTDVITNGVSTSESNVTLNGITTNTWYLHLVARDNFDNTSSSTYTLKVDTSTPDIIAITGLNNDTWQNTDAGPIISWTDPNSPSDDTFYITNDGSEPTSANYTYTTTSNTYDLPNQAEGITTIKVRAMNGVSTYSTPRSFVVKFDSTNPIINTLTSSTHPNPSLWYNSSTATFNWTITENGSGIQNTWYLLDTNPTTTNENVVSGGTTTSNTTATINDLTTNTWYFHLVVKDNCSNTTSSIYTLKVDISVPDIIAVTGNNNDTWQNVDSGPIISWTDPNSLSDDTFYITNDGSEPTSTNYTYTTTSNTYDLPSQADGITTIKVRARNGIGTYGTTRSFIIKYEVTNPVISSLTSSTHPNSGLWYNLSTATFNWVSNDVDSGVQNTWYIINTNATTSDADVISGGTATSNTTATVENLTTNTWYFHLVVRDNANNTIASTYSLNVDMSIPDIIAVTGDNDDTWQNINSGPVISWTDPSSLSDDTFYITNNGSEPTSTNYAYTTTNNSYDLPNQAEGITTIKVRAQNGIGAYSITRTFTIKYDSTNPVIDSLTSSTHPDSNTWYHSPSATFSWTITEEGSGIQNSWYLLDTNPTTTNEDVVSGGTTTSDATATISNLTSNIQYFHLVIKDNCGGTVASTYTIKADVSVPNIVAVTGDYNDTWQNVNSGPVISWTDPNSLSDDTFYITTDGTFPASTNYAYTTTNNSYDLPNQAEGITTIKVRAVNGAGTYGEPRTFILKYDNTSPVINSLTSSTHPDSNTWYSSTTAIFNWTITENGSGVQNTWYLLDTNPTTADEDVISNGATIVGTTATINNIGNGTWYFHLVTRDNCEATTSATYSFKIDDTIPDIVAVTGDYNDVWQNVNAGPVISWTDPNSSSDDTFYITNDGTEPTATSFTYTTTNSSYDLPDQAEGIVSIKVRALNGAGVYSTTKSFIVKNDNTAPTIASLTSSTHPDSNIWYSSSTAIFNWTITEEESGIQNTWYLLNGNATVTDNDVINTGITTSSSEVTINEITNSTSYFHLVTRDNSGNTSSATYSLKIDNSSPDIIGITGLYNNQWQNIDSGPVISWTDPNSLSNDTFYITNDGTEPTVTNYRYTLTNSSFDLPDQNEGEITIKVRAMSGAGIYSETRSFIVKYDDTNPTISSLTSSTHSDSNTWYSSSTATFNWSILEEGSGIKNTWYLLNNNASTSEANVISNGTSITERTVTINDIDSNIWYFHLVTIDNCDQTTSSTYTFKIDTSAPDIINITGLYNNEWQDIDAGPVISWTDPNSLSNDTFYITNNGSEPTSTNYTYTTTSNIFNLPDQEEGEVTIKVKAINGANTSSEIRTFIVKYNSANPEIPTLMSSTHPNQEMWYTSSNLSINWATTDNRSGISKVWSLFDQTETQTNTIIANTGTETTATGTYNTAIATNGTWYFHLLAKNTQGLEFSKRFRVNIDNTTPDIVAVTGNNNNIWQNVDAGPVISWTDPNSISNDTFFITNNGTEPTTTNFAYTTTSNTYDLPNQKQGETTIKVRASNGAGTYSETRNFIVRYDGIAPANVSELIATTTTNSITLTWVDPTIFDFTHVVIVKNTSHIPLSITDGTIVYEETSPTFTDTNLTDATDYYYAIFSLDSVGNRSTGAIIQAKTLSITPDEPTIPETPTTPTIPNTPATPINVVIPPIDNNTKIIKAQDLPEEEKINVTTEEKEVTTTSIGNLHVYPGQTLQIEIPIKAIGYENADIKQVVLTINNEAYNLEYNPTSKTYYTTINAPAIKGAYDTSITTISNNNKNLFTVTTNLLVDPYGYVFSILGKDEVRISDAKVSLYTKKDGIEILYQSSAGINNPQYTNAQGEYQYFVEPGEYKLVIEAQGYIPSETEWFIVEKSIIEKNIQMKRNPYFWYSIIAIAEIAAGFSLFVIRRKKKNKIYV